MNNKNKDIEHITAEKIQNNYPQITLVSETSTKLAENSSNDCTPKTPSLVPTKIPVTTSSVTKQTIPSIKKTSSPAVDKKIPPYVNTLPQDPLRASKIPAQKPTFVKTPPKATSEKGTGTIESAITSLQTSPPVRTPAAGDVKKSHNTLPVRASIPSAIPKPADKAVVSSTTTLADESKPTGVSEGEHKNVEKVTPVLPTRSPQIHSRTSDVLEKNIQSNILTFTSRPMNRNSPSIVKVIPSKDTKTAETNTVANVVSISKSAATSPSTPKNTLPKPQIVPTSSLCKAISKSVSIQNMDSPKIVNRLVVSANNSPKSDTASSKPQIVEPILKPAQKVLVVTSADTSVRTNSPSVSVPSSPKIQTHELTASPASIMKSTKQKLTSPNIPILSLSEVETNEDIIKAINSGSTASVGKNVTISSASVENASSTSDSKIRNVSSETTIETIAKQMNNPGSPAQKNKNGNPTEGVGQSSKQDSTPNSRASSPGESLTPKRNEIPGLTEKVENLIDIMSPLKKKIDEPVECLTISSDEETEPDQLVSSDHSEISVSILNKEPPIERNDDASNRSSDGSAMEKEVDTMLETTTGEGFLNLNCRTVRIGSYKIIPKNGVTLSKYGLKIVVPPLNNSNDSVAVKVPIHDIAKVLVHYNRALPVIFYYITPQAGAKIRQILKMNDPNNYYFDPNSSDESHRRITLLPEKFSEDDRYIIKNYYLDRDVIEELTHTEANQLLVRSAPQDIQKTVRLPPNPVQTIMVYPPPPAKGGISINTEDYSCLAEDTYLNDVIIDFYLKYLYHEKLSEEDRQKTHIFSSFFYKRLTDKATPVPRMLQNSKTSDTTITPAEIRHDRVKKWTKNIDIFSKDYIVIPLNENQHWFLAIICFPGLNGPVRFSDNTPIDLESSKKTEATIIENSKSNESDPDSSQTRRIGSTTITPVRKEAYTLADEDGDMEDRDEASGADEDVDELFTSDEDTDELYSDPEPGEVGGDEAMPKKKPEKEPIKQPCILIFDSLKSASRARIIATLREYLHVEYKTKRNGEERDFSKNVVKGACPRVPQQTNYTDCGLYVLQYVEMFFESKITDFHIPIRTLSRWFDPEIVSRKRYFIQRLLLQLMEEQKINVNALQLPELHLSPDHYSHQYDTDEMDEYEDGYYDEEDEESSNLGHLVGYDEEDMEISEHEYRIRQRLEAEGIEYMEEEEEDGVHSSRYSVFDSADDSSSNDFSDDDDTYKDLDEIQHVVRVPRRQRRTLINVTRCGDGPDDEEILQEEEEEIEEEETVVNVDEDELKLNNLNKETVTISRMPASSSVMVKATQSDESKSSSRLELEQLMNARPWKKLNEVSIERATEEDCPNKKFKAN